jgi:uncharacterized membrane protein YgcG
MRKSFGVLATAGFLFVSGLCKTQQERRQKYLSNIPNPTVDAAACHMKRSSFLCDLDNILSTDEKKNIAEEGIGYISLPSKHICGPNRNDEIQIAVAVVEKMYVDKSNMNEDSTLLIETAQDLAIQTHNDWGVGTVHESCDGTGVLLFLSIEDKTCFISVGKALSQVLTDHRLDYVISKVMRPDLRHKQYDKAIIGGVRQIKSFIVQGPPSIHERLHFISLDLTPFVLFVLIAALFVRITEYRQRRSRSEYAAVCSQLNEIERSRALALQGMYNCTSCPICLEPFQVHDKITQSTNRTEEKDNDTTQERLLHDVSIGSDGLPVRLLRCGHIFDETCWHEWVKNGRGDATSCPICRADIGITPTANSSTSSTTGTTEHPTALVDHHPNEMRFRLSRLMVRYPRYISQSNIVLWTEDGYDGPIVRDPDFIRRDPVNRQYTKQERFPETGFGGGKSSGGRGGRW